MESFRKHGQVRAAHGPSEAADASCHPASPCQVASPANGRARTLGSSSDQSNQSRRPRPAPSSCVMGWKVGGKDGAAARTHRATAGVRARRSHALQVSSTSTWEGHRSGDTSPAKNAIGVSPLHWSSDDAVHQNANGFHEARARRRQQEARAAVRRRGEAGRDWRLWRG